VVGAGSRVRDGDGVLSLGEGYRGPLACGGGAMITPREFLAVALMISSHYDVRLMENAQVLADLARVEPSCAYWSAYRDGDALRVGARLALWFEAQS
jgi:hypothetical protein